MGVDKIRCLVCGGRHFRRGYYEIDVDVEIYPSAYNDVNVSTWSHDDVHMDVDVDVNTSIHNEIVESAEITLKLVSEENDKLSGYDQSVNVYKYNCETCGFIMNFTKEKNVESKYEEKKRKQKENSYDWTDFGR